MMGDESVFGENYNGNMQPGGGGGAGGGLLNESDDSL
jgi:hypothetical protein